MTRRMFLRLVAGVGAVLMLPLGARRVMPAAAPKPTHKPHPHATPTVTPTATPVIAGTYREHLPYREHATYRT